MKRFKHQQDLFDKTKDLPFYALLWEMRVGKTLPIIDTADYQFTKGGVDAVLVLAPSGVHINWSRIVLPEHRPKDSVIEFASGNAGKVGFQKLLEACLRDKSNLLWVCMNVEATITEAGKEVIKALAERRKCMLVVDESDEFKNPQAKRTKSMLAQAHKFPFRRIMTGTSAPQGPFDLWSQFFILSPVILGQRFVPFKQRYGVFKRVRYGGPAFDQLVAYKDLDHLSARIAPFSSRLTQKDIGIDIPMEPVTRFFEMSKEQKAAYKAMRDEMMVEYAEGKIVSAQNALAWLLRLQQISRGFLPTGEDTPPVDLGSGPSIDSLMKLLNQIEGKTIIWCRFRHDVDRICRQMTDEKMKVARHDGLLSLEDRAANLEMFKKDDACRWLVGTPATGGVGIDLSCADSMVFYSSNYDLRERLQAIARMQGVNQKSKSLLLVDMVAVDAKDADIITRLQAKAKMMGELMGDDKRLAEEQVKGLFGEGPEALKFLMEG